MVIPANAPITIRVHITLGLEVEDVLAPYVRLYDNELDHPKYQAFIDQDRL